MLVVSILRRLCVTWKSYQLVKDHCSQETQSLVLLTDLISISIVFVGDQNEQVITLLESNIEQIVLIHLTRYFENGCHRTLVLHVHAAKHMVLFSIALLTHTSIILNTILYDIFQGVTIGRLNENIIFIFFQFIYIVTDFSVRLLCTAYSQFA